MPELEEGCEKPNSLTFVQAVIFELLGLESRSLFLESF